jgi:hypothetical protein
LALDIQQKRKLREALGTAFTPDGFDLMLDQRVDKKRYNIVADEEFPIIVHQVIEAAEREGWTANLIRGALEANPGNPQLVEFVKANPAYNPSTPLQQRQDIADTLVETQKVLDKNLAVLQENFQSVLDNIDVMSDYKKLHDELHNLIFAVFPLIEEAASLLPAGKDAKSNLARHDKTLRTAIDNMKEAAERKKVEEEESKWIEELDLARKKLKSVLDDFDKENLESALQEIRDVLETQPTSINKKLWRAMNSEKSRLPELVGILEKVLTYLKQLEPASPGVKQFETGIESLKTLTAKLDALISEHDTWQEVVGKLPEIGEWIESDISKFKAKWQKVRTRIAPFYVGKTDEETAADLEKADARLELALRAMDGPAPAVTKLDPGLFADYCEKASWRFYDVDGMLLERCEYLRDIRKQLP